MNTRRQPCPIYMNSVRTRPDMSDTDRYHCMAGKAAHLSQVAGDRGNRDLQDRLIRASWRYERLARECVER